MLLLEIIAKCVAVCLIVMFGLIFGSFLNVVAMRTLAGMSIVYPPSHCPVCGTRLKPKELIPIVSYLLQKGRCRTCNAPISPLYPLGELLTGVYALIWYYPLLTMSMDHLLWYGLSGLFFIALVVILTITDLSAMVIPDRILLLAAPFTIVLVLWKDDQHWLFHLFGALLYGSVFLLTYWLSRGKMGLGDVKYAFLLGFWLGAQFFLFFLLLASSTALIVALGRTFVDRNALRAPLPFAPFMGGAAIVLTLYGEALWRWYLHLFHIT